jgi:hypothetical protein
MFFDSLTGLPHLRSLTIDYPVVSILQNCDFAMGERLAQMRHPSLISINLLADLDLAQISWKREDTKWVGYSDLWTDSYEIDIDSCPRSVLREQCDSTEGN